MESRQAWRREMAERTGQFVKLGFRFFVRAGRGKHQQSDAGLKQMPTDLVAGCLKVLFAVM